MAPTSILFHAIKSLAGAEVRYFRSFAKRRIKNGSASYLKLFDLVLKSETYNEDELVAELGVANFPALKMRLTELVAEALQERESYSKGLPEITSLHQQIELLLKRGLMDLMWKKMAKAEALCERYEDFDTWRKLLYTKDNFLMMDTPAGYTPPRLEGFDEIYESVKEKARNLEVYNELQGKVTVALRSGAAAKYQAATYLLSHPALSDDAPRLSVRAEVSFCRLKRIALRWTSQLTASAPFPHRIVSLLDAAPDLLFDSNMQVLFVKQLSNIGLYAAATNDFDTTKTIIERLSAFKDIRHLVFERIHLIELRASMQRLDRDLGSKAVEAIEKGLRTFEHKITDEGRTAYCFLIAHYYLCFGESANALKWVIRLRMLERVGFRKELQDFGELLFLLCHFDLGNDEFLQNEARKVRGHLRKRGTLSNFETTVIAGLSTASKGNTPGDRLNALKRMGEKIKSILQEPANMLKENHFPFEAWIAAKETGRSPMEMLLRFSQNQG